MNYNNKSESYKNINRAFCDEAAGHVKYRILSENAEKDGKHDLAALYRRLSGEELEHAKIWYGEQGAHDEPQNSISAEGMEASTTYPKYAAMAEMEGYEELADRFLANGMAEATHRELLMKYHDDVEKGDRNKAYEDSVWRCTHCGYRHIGTTPPQRCPLCDYNHTAYTID